MPRYRNIGSLPLNYGEGCPRVEPGEEFNSDDYPRMQPGMLEQHLRLELIAEVEPAAAAALPETPEVREL